jgi:hypothetical protein
MSTKNLLSKAATKKETLSPTAEQADAPQGQEKGSTRLRRTLTFDPRTVSLLNRMKAQKLLDGDANTDFGRIIDEAVLQFAQSKGLV